MTREMLVWMAECPIAESFRIHPSLLREIDELSGVTTVAEIELAIDPSSSAFRPQPSQHSLSGKPLMIDDSIRPQTLQIIARGRKTPSVAIELEVASLV